MRRKGLSIFLVATIVGSILCGCTSMVPTNDVMETEILEDTRAEEQVNVEESVPAQNSKEEESINFSGGMRIVDVIDDYTVTCLLERPLTIPERQYTFGDTVVASDGETYMVCEYMSAIEACNPEDDYEYAHKTLVDMDKNIEISFCREVDLGDGPVKLYYVIDNSATDGVYELSDPSATNPFIGDPLTYKAETVTVNVTTDANFLYLDTESANANMCENISVEDFLHGNFPETALYHTSEDKYYINYDPKERCYSEGYGDINEGVLVRFEEIYTP